jgi:hypothetical protein
LELPYARCAAARPSERAAREGLCGRADGVKEGCGG